MELGVLLLLLASDLLAEAPESLLLEAPEDSVDLLLPALSEALFPLPLPSPLLAPLPAFSFELLLSEPLLSELFPLLPEMPL